ncbi:hypothetical protein BD410DRAFT_612498 [Rickenella mellea]|uniref:Uncharacterized protein n=1 Tax=Rickenella mellea TaxID=50990 RepID=A0A4Y7PMZ1_9AGAM|nr:hypothetical protein BD410DRAFT_612498 [Rickenella mellea]
MVNMNANPVINVAQLPTDAAAQLIAMMPVLATPALTQSSAINVITTLAVGTPLACQGVLAPLGVIVQGGVFDFQSQEWGMGYDSGTNRWVIVLGGPGATAYVGNGLHVCCNFIHSHPREATLTAFCNLNLAQLQNGLFDMGHGAVSARTLRAVLTWFVDNGYLSRPRNTNYLPF